MPGTLAPRDDPPIATKTEQDRDEVLGTSAVPDPVLGIGLVMNAWDVYFRKPITEQELEREIDRLEGSDRGSLRG